MVFYKVCMGYRRGIMYFMRYSIGNSIGHPTGYSIRYSIWYIDGIIEGILSAVGYSIRCIYIHTYKIYRGYSMRHYLWHYIINCKKFLKVYKGGIL